MEIQIHREEIPIVPEDRPTSPQAGELSPLDDAPIVIHGPMHGTGPDAGDLAPSAAVAASAVPARSSAAAPPAVIPEGRSSADRAGVAAQGNAATEPRRALGLDAVRGFFLVLMTFSFTTHAGLLPAWLYHVQTPPPTFALADVPGIGWPDLAYPGFIFAMAAALPIALARRIDVGETELGIILGAIRRFVMLFVFALLIGHSNTFFIGYTQAGRALAVLGFAIMFAIFVQRRRDWSERTLRWVNRAGWIAAVLFLALSPLVYDSTFLPARRDEIIAYLAVASLFGSVLWYFTRDNLSLRLAALAGVVALYLGARGDGWIQQWWWSSPAPWLFRPTDLVVMIAVIPGTIVGDSILRWMRSAPDGPPMSASGGREWSATRVTTLALLALATLPIVVFGLWGRWMPETAQAGLLLCLAGAILVRRPTSASERLLRDLFAWAAAWLLIGLLLEPSEGGIKKVPDTLSYFFTVTGLAMMLLVTLTAVVEVLGRRKMVQALIDVGHNAMLCYVLYTVFLNSLWEMVPPLRGVLQESGGAELLRGVVTTIVVVLLVRAFTRKRIFWRA